MSKEQAGQQYSEAEISMVLDTYMYMNYQEAREGERLQQILQELEGHPDYGGGGIHSGEYSILKEAAESPEIGNLTVDCQSVNMGYDSGTAACTFVTPEEDTVYMVYRGTGDGEWPDNGIGMTEASTIQQRQALSYFEEAVEYLDIQPEQRLIVTGHSKGGNKAQFVAMETAYSELLDACYSVDGQGFSEAAISKWKTEYGQTEYESRIEKLYGLHGENDYVSVLGHSIIPEEKIRYMKTPVEKSNFAGYHDIKYMFATLDLDEESQACVTTFHGRKNRDADARGVLGDYGAKLSLQVMELEPKKRDGCAAVMMQAMEATGGQKGGLNGEKLSFFDVMDFVFSGIPVIGSSILAEPEGKNLLQVLMGEESFSEVLPGNKSLWVNPRVLYEQGEQMTVIAGVLSRQIADLEKISNQTFLCAQTGAQTGFRLMFATAELKSLEGSLLRISEIQKEIALAYQSWDEKSSISL